MMAWVQRGTAYCVLLFVGVTVEVRAQNATSTSSQTALSTDNATKPAESGEREKVDAPPSLSAATLAMRRARCATAICFGQDFKYGLEPLVELPVGKTFTSNGLGALANFENSHDISATFTAGLRFWILHDAIRALPLSTESKTCADHTRDWRLASWLTLSGSAWTSTNYGTETRTQLVIRIFQGMLSCRARPYSRSLYPRSR